MIRVMTAAQLAAWYDAQDSESEPTPQPAPRTADAPVHLTRQPELVLGLVGIA